MSVGAALQAEEKPVSESRLFGLSSTYTQGETRVGPM